MKFNLITVVVFLSVFLIGISLGISYVANTITEETISVTITGKERVYTKDKGYYLIFTDVETFKNEDSIWYGKYNSSDLYGKFKEGEKYTLTVTGFRVPFLSMYRNIVGVSK